METKRIDLESGHFDANGHRYRVTSTLSVARFEEFERLQVHVGFGKDFKTMYDRLKDAYDFMNKSKAADAAVIVHNIINGIAQNLEKRDHPILQLCALFLNREDEDVSVFDPDLSKQKVDDWRKEGYAVEDFFQLAFNLVDGFIDIYEGLIQNISQKVEGMSGSDIGNTE